jgi:phage repressor protein C with HTH and peptisase S24 domain
MGDGRRLTIQERLQIALETVPRGSWAVHFSRSEKQLRRYLEGADIPFSVLSSIAAKTGVPLDWLAAGRPTRDGAEQVPAPDSERLEVESRRKSGSVAEGKLPAIIEVMQEKENTDRKGTHYFVQSVRQSVPTLRGYIAATRENARDLEEGSLVDHPQVNEFLAFSRVFLEEKLQLDVEALILIEVIGDEMDPSIPSGSILTVNLKDQPLENGGVYVLRVGLALVVKRLELRADESLLLHSDNIRYAPEIIDRERFRKLSIGQVEMWTVARNNLSSSKLRPHLK